ncbi:hypothetical protein [Sinorhizobium sp. GL28]|uniref:hypothetical protein n=1 Tax=Sinorhizobium sp. GL28 TaxID=1358418 RepID=UPI00071C50A1|nr:hypothetical protein [Sinorhizobium sp. GL28]KSV94869.1 hypothetical protein N184_36080 [Sinorhizobium sp. GL28]
MTIKTFFQKIKDYLWAVLTALFGVLCMIIGLQNSRIRKQKEERKDLEKQVEEAKRESISSDLTKDNLNDSMKKTLDVMEKTSDLKDKADKGEASYNDIVDAWNG